MVADPSEPDLMAEVVAVDEVMRRTEGAPVGQHCDVTGLPEVNCGHCADFHDYLRRENLPPNAEDAAVRLLDDALFLRMNGERPPGAPRDNPKAETWADWDRRTEGFLRALRVPGDRERCVYCSTKNYEPGYGCHACGAATVEDVAVAGENKQQGKRG